MDQYQVTLPKNVKALVLHKRIGVRRPQKVLFFKIRNKERLIAYTTMVQIGQLNETVEIFKSWRNGEWVEGLLRNGQRIDAENELTIQLKKEIDRYENTFGKNAYTQLF